MSTPVTRSVSPGDRTRIELLRLVVRRRAGVAGFEPGVRPRSARSVVIRIPVVSRLTVGRWMTGVADFHFPRERCVPSGVSGPLTALWLTYRHLNLNDLMLYVLYMPDREGQDRGRRFQRITRTIRNRNAGRCRCCQQTESGTHLSVHHLVPDSEVPEEFDSHLPVNLVSLCSECHAKLEQQMLARQFEELDIDQYRELILSDKHRQALNNRLEEIGPEILNTKKISKAESIELINYASSEINIVQRTLGEY